VKTIPAVLASAIAIAWAWAGPVAAGQSAGETFDPESLQEDLLLIQPAAPTVTPAVAAPIPDSAAAPAATGERAVFRVQLAALSSSETAGQLRNELAGQLGVPLVVEVERGLFLVRAGAFATAEAAGRFRDELRLRRPDLTTAYVVLSNGSLPSESGTAIGDSGAVAPPAMESTFGWRILLDQFLAPEDADHLRQEAILNLERTDVEVVFSAPWHRVEVGSFRTEADAQEALTSVRFVYPSALKVRGQILVPREP
jgi:hypothetical protein